MSNLAIEHVSYEKGWGVLFEVKSPEQAHRFCIHMDTLTAPGLRHRTKRTFPEIFEANIDILLLVAEALIRSSQLSSDIWGTEILASHIGEVTGAGPNNSCMDSSVNRSLPK